MHPVKSVPVRIPGYKLVFDLPGLPYLEPAFSSIAEATSSSQLPLPISSSPDVLSMAYLLHRSEYAALIESEGGTVSYRQIQVTAVPHSKDAEATQGEIKGWTLQTRRPRLHPHPMPSLRYINLIRTGAKQNDFPDYYQAYLDGVQPYIIHKSQVKLLLGRVLFVIIWAPAIGFALSIRLLKLGKLGDRIAAFVFTAMWTSHDVVFSRIFGRGDVVK